MQYGLMSSPNVSMLTDSTAVGLAKCQSPGSESLYIKQKSKTVSIEAMSALFVTKLKVISELAQTA